MRRAPKKTDLNISDLRQCLRYDPSTGLLTRASSGKPAGFVGNRGYLRVKFQSREWLGHVLAWAYVHGYVPELEIDHINRNPADNSIGNLRLVTHVENMANRHIGPKFSPNNEPIPSGIYYNRRERRFKVGVYCSGKSKHVGTYTTLAEATLALSSFRYEA